MSLNLMTVFKTSDLQKFGQTASNVVSLAFKTNKKNGSKIGRAVLDNGTTLIKTVTATGVEIGQVLKIPEINSIAQRNAVIKDLTKNKITQEELAEKLATTHSVISAYENGHTLILTAFLINLCTTYNLSADTLCNRKND